ncbi:MAG: hypothetical protein Q9222_000387 [Ikaeria aurantiellina]
MAVAKTNINAIYAALEDCMYISLCKVIEKSPSVTPPVYEMPVVENGSRLRQFIALQARSVLILGPRRNPPVPARAATTNSSIPIQTALGFSTLKSEDYVEAVQKLNPDVVLGLADYEYLKRPGVKRLERMGDRTLAWLKEMIDALKANGRRDSNTALFAPILPIDAGQQCHYLEALSQDLARDLSGLVVYEAASIDAIPKELRHLPRLGLTNLSGPRDILHQTSLGIDLFVPSFVGEATDAGLALTFEFPGPVLPKGGQRLVLGIDMWAGTFISDVSPLVADCGCYTCKTHHRAFVRHLLDAKEMLAWVLLQIHNYHVMDVFFASVRQSLSKGMYDNDRKGFERCYERNFPLSTGQGPRLRGYQVKSGPAEPRRNPQAFRQLVDAQEKLAEAPLLSPDANGERIEKQGFAEKLSN